MDIDYIKVYKPKLHDYSLPYKTINDFMNTNTHESLIEKIQVSPFQSSITSNSNNFNELFFRGANDRLYKTKLENNQWTTNLMSFNYVPTFPSSLVAGNVVYNPTYNYVLYAGKDNRIQYFTNFANNNWHWFIDDYWESSQNLISSSQGSMDVTNDGKIVYRGIDDKIHIFKWNTFINKWDKLAINHTYGLVNGNPNADYVAGDVVVEKSTNNIIYRGGDGRLQIFWQTSPYVYQHGWIDNNFMDNSTLVKNQPGSIISSSKGIFYVGVDDKVHRFYWNGISFVHQVPNYTYGLIAGMVDADFIKGSINYLPQFSFVIYVGRDGRIQRFKIPENFHSNAWEHYWIDDYWNTADFISFNSSFSSNNLGSLTTSIDNKMVYTAKKNQTLSYFKFEACEILNPPCNSLYPVRLTKKPDSVNFIYTKTKTVENIYPNPVENEIYVVGSYDNKNVILEISDFQGKIYLSHKILNFENMVNVEFLLTGPYILKVSDGKKRSIFKFIKI